MKTAVMIGAGNIGRGFIGQVLSDSGYEIIFVDVDEMLIEQLNCNGAYNLTLNDGESSTTRRIAPVRALCGRNTSAVAQALADCTIAAVAVGKNALPHVMPNLVAGLRKRGQVRPGNPLNLLICENIHKASSYVRRLLTEHVLESESHLLENIGLVETTIGRMVPVPTAILRETDPTGILAEPYCRLPVDKKCFLGEIPELLYTETFDPFAFYEEQKLYIHNMGHALCAYLGAEKDYQFIWQTMEDKDIRGEASRAMHTLADAIAGAYDVDAAPLHELAEDLLRRFANKQLGDTIARVAQDPLRKLAPGDRFLGAMERCKSQGLDCPAIERGIIAAWRYAENI